MMHNEYTPFAAAVLAVRKHTELVYLLYCCVMVSMLFVLYKLPKFFSYAFYPGFVLFNFARMLVRALQRDAA